MAANEIHVGDIGTVLRRTVQDNGDVVDISGATTKQILLKGPSGALKTKTASFTTDGTDGQLQWTTILNDLDEAGQWGLQVKVVLPSGTWSSDIEWFTVYGNLS